MNRNRTVVVLAAVVGVAACSSIEVRTATSPDANLTALKTFNVLPHAAPGLPSSDPMLVNSMSSRALRADIFEGFEGRGYQVSDQPNFVVAYYASAKQKLNVTDWDYGYPYYHPWWAQGAPAETITQYTEGTVIVDVLDPRTRELLWRGQGKAEVSDDEAKYEQDLAKTVNAILDKFPLAIPSGRISSAG